MRAHGAHFSLGKWGLPVNILAVTYGTVVAFNIAWPRVAVYGNSHWYFQYGAYVFVGGVTAFGAICYHLVYEGRPSLSLPSTAPTTAKQVRS